METTLETTKHMEQEHTLRLLVNDAEALENVLRNAGQASRLSYA